MSETQTSASGEVLRRFGEDDSYYRKVVEAEAAGPVGYRQYG